MPYTRLRDEKHIPALASREDGQIHQQITTQMDILSRRRFPDRSGTWVETHERWVKINHVQKRRREYPAKKVHYEESTKGLDSSLALLENNVDVEEETRGSAETRL